MNANKWICLTRLFHSDCQSLTLEHYKYMIFKISESWENEEENILFNIWKESDDLLKNLKHKIAKILDLKEEWDITALCEKYDFTIVMWTVGCLLQREIDVLQEGSTLKQPGWKSTTTSCVTSQFYKNNKWFHM